MTRPSGMCYTATSLLLENISRYPAINILAPYLIKRAYTSRGNALTGDIMEGEIAFEALFGVASKYVKGFLNINFIRMVWNSFDIVSLRSSNRQSTVNIEVRSE